jgi:hypothetical protein
MYMNFNFLLKYDIIIFQILLVLFELYEAFLSLSLYSKHSCFVLSPFSNICHLLVFCKLKRDKKQREYDPAKVPKILGLFGLCSHRHLPARQQILAQARIQRLEILPGPGKCVV